MANALRLPRFPWETVTVEKGFSLRTAESIAVENEFSRCPAECSAVEKGLSRLPWEFVAGENEFSRRPGVGVGVEKGFSRHPAVCGPIASQLCCRDGEGGPIALRSQRLTAAFLKFVCSSDCSEEGTLRKAITAKLASGEARSGALDTSQLTPG